jgi:3-mercaptopyruvate sulfurtransferase SseA
VLVAALVGVPIGLAACGPDSTAPQNQSDAPRIGVQELKERLDGGEGILVVDARSASAFADRHIPGAVSIPLDEVESRLDELPRDQDIVFY